MAIDIILQAFDTYIARLKSIRAEYLKITEPTKPAKRKRKFVAPAKKRTISPEARERIRAGVKRRWAKVRAAEKKAAK